LSRCLFVFSINLKEDGILNRDLSDFAKRESAKDQLPAENVTLSENFPPSAKMRLLGILPLIFFLAQAVHYWRIDQLGHMLWMCNIGNLVLALGLFFEKPLLIRIAAIWMIPGLFIWLRYVVFAWGIFLTSTLAHVGGLLVAMIAVRKVGMERRTWVYAFGWYLAMQLISRFFTSPDLNVNLAHKIQDGFEQSFGSYWEFWLTLTVVTAVVLWAFGWMLWKVWPARTRATF
jgi:hypothetical protein